MIVIDIFPYEGVVKRAAVLMMLFLHFELSPVLLDEVRAGGRIPLIIGRGLTGRAREALGLGETDLFKVPAVDCNGISTKALHFSAKNGW